MVVNELYEKSSHTADDENETVNNIPSLDGGDLLVDEVSKVKFSSSKRLYSCIKRIFDLISSACALVVLSLLLLLVAIVVKLTSKGPVFFRDQRVGKGGKNICVYKFRTMYIDAEEHVRDYLSEEQYQKWLVERKVDNDPRITPVGKFLRKTSIDELPCVLVIKTKNLTATYSLL